MEDPLTQLIEELLESPEYVSHSKQQSALRTRLMQKQRWTTWKRVPASQAHTSLGLWASDTLLIEENRQSKDIFLHLLTRLSASRVPSRCTACNCFIAKEESFDVLLFGASAICGSEKVDISFAHVIGSVVNEGSSSEIREDST